MKHLITFVLLLTALFCNAQGAYRMTEKLSKGQSLTSKTSVDVRTYSLGDKTTYLEVVQDQRIIFELKVEIRKISNSTKWEIIDLTGQFVYGEYDTHADVWVLFNKNIWVEIVPN